MSNRDTLPDIGDGGAAALIAGLVVVALLVVGAFYLLSLLGLPAGDVQTISPIHPGMVTAG